MGWDLLQFWFRLNSPLPGLVQNWLRPLEGPRLNLALEWSPKQGAAAYRICATDPAITRCSHPTFSAASPLPRS